MATCVYITTCGDREGRQRKSRKNESLEKVNHREEGPLQRSFFHLPPRAKRRTNTWSQYSSELFIKSPNRSNWRCDCNSCRNSTTSFKQMHKL